VTPRHDSDADFTPDAGVAPADAPAGLNLAPRTGAPGAPGEDAAAHRGGGRGGNRSLVVIAIIVVLMVAGALLVRSLGNATLYFYQANEAVAQKAELADKRFRLFGTVDGSTVQRTADGVTFTVSYAGATVPVQHVGDPPQLFQSGIPVVLEGRWSADGSTFLSDRILVKHTEEYVEKNPDRKTPADAAP
jgi:cytochrome c-type biogenesis protein CcmE